MRNATNRFRAGAAKRVLWARRLALALLLNACYTWRPVQLTPTHPVGEKQRVRIVRSNGSTLMLVGPRVISDSLVSDPPATMTRIAIPLTDVRRTDTRQLSQGRTLLLVVGVAVAVYLAVGAFAASQMEFGLP
jgi:hypothetical protein